MDAAVKKFENLPITLTLERVDLALLKDSKQLIRKVYVVNEWKNYVHIQTIHIISIISII